ncbi:hypothetical protein AOLI_G00201140 [Acnodon oligacanthus]
MRCENSRRDDKKVKSVRNRSRPGPSESSLRYNGVRSGKTGDKICPSIGARLRRGAFQGLLRGVRYGRG